MKLWLKTYTVSFVLPRSSVMNEADESLSFRNQCLRSLTICSIKVLCHVVGGDTSLTTCLAITDIILSFFGF